MARPVRQIMIIRQAGSRLLNTAEAREEDSLCVPSSNPGTRIKERSLKVKKSVLEIRIPKPEGAKEKEKKVPIE